MNFLKLIGVIFFSALSMQLMADVQHTGHIKQMQIDANDQAQVKLQLCENGPVCDSACPDLYIAKNSVARKQLALQLQFAMYQDSPVTITYDNSGSCIISSVKSLSQ